MVLKDMIEIKRPKEWKEFSTEISEYIHALPVTWGPDYMIYQREKYGLSEPQKQAIRFWLWLEIMKILTGLPKEIITGKFDENYKWPELGNIEIVHWDKVRRLVLKVSKNHTEETVVQGLLSYFRQYQKATGYKEKVINPSEKRKWIRSEYDQNGKNFQSDSGWAKATAKKFEEKFGTNTSPSSMKRYGIYKGRN